MSQKLKDWHAEIQMHPAWQVGYNAASGVEPASRNSNPYNPRHSLEAAKAALAWNQGYDDCMNDRYMSQDDS